MPIYEFECRECGTHFEQLLSFSAHGHPPCPNCQSNHVSRMMSKPAIHFKGSGWYVTDSKNSSRKSANGDGDRVEKPEKSESSDKTGKSEKSGDTGAGTNREPNGEKSAAVGGTGGEAKGEKPAAQSAPADSARPAGS